MSKSVSTQNDPDTRRRTLALIAFIAGGAVPIQLVTLSFGYAQYVQGVAEGPELVPTAHQFAEWYVPLVYVPALVVLAGIALYSRRRYPGLFRRIVVGFGAGLVATMALDAWRQTGVIYGWLPGDTPKMFGMTVTGSKNMAIWHPVGLLVHYFNGTNFGLVYAFVWGKQGSYRSAAVLGHRVDVNCRTGNDDAAADGTDGGPVRRAVLLAGPLSHHARRPCLLRTRHGPARGTLPHREGPGLAYAVSNGRAAQMTPPLPRT